jgi:acyl-coenzyme A thioesterase PaaI-like protein
MWCRIGASSWKPFVGFIGTSVLSGYAVGFTGSFSTHPERSRSSRQINNFLPTLGSFPAKSLCEELGERGEIDGYHRMALPERGHSGGHAIFGSLLEDNKIESYDVYRRREGSTDANIIVAYVKLGNRIDGHPGVVHGGILSLIFDDALGFGYEALGVKMAVTANLNVDFRAPVMAGTPVRVVAQLERREGRKLYWKAQMTSVDKNILYAEATSLYMIPRSAS